MYELVNKVILITGAANGIGATFVRIVLYEGVKTAVVNSTVKAIELMRKDKGGRGGTVVNVSSIAALCQPCPAFFVYMGTKSAVMQFSNCIGKEEYFTRTGVRVVTICFGVTNTEIVYNMRSFDDRVNEELKEIIDLYPMQTPLSAAKGALEAVKHGTSGSTWLVANNKPAKDITSTVQKAYGLLSDLLS